MENLPDEYNSKISHKNIKTLLYIYSNFAKNLDSKQYDLEEFRNILKRIIK